MNFIFRSLYLPDKKGISKSVEGKITFYMPFSALECLFSAKHIVLRLHFFILDIGRYKYDRRDCVKISKPNGIAKNDR